MTTTESIGYCQWCGLLDHHLVYELCPQCANKTVMRGHDADQCGREADVSHIIPALLRYQAH